MMGNEQSGLGSRARSAPRQGGGSAAGNKAISDDQLPPPYTPVDASPTTTGPLLTTAGSSELRRSRSYGRDSTEPQLNVPNSADVRRSSSTSRVSTPSGASVGGFRFDPDAGRRPQSNLPRTDPAAAPASSHAAAAASRGGARRSNTAENLLEMLRKYNTLILVDDSSSVRESAHCV